MSGRAGPARSGERLIAWPLVAALCVTGLLAGGGLLLATGDGRRSTPTTPTISPSPTASPALEDAQLAGDYGIRLVVRTSRNLASLAGIDRPVPGRHRRGSWRFYATCDPGSSVGTCPASWGGREGALVPEGTSWIGTVVGPRAACFGDREVPGPIQLQLEARDAAEDAGTWVVRSFTGTWSVAFRCPGFAGSRGTVEVSGHRIGG